LIDVPVYKAYLFPNGVYEACVSKVEMVENSFYKNDPENSVKNQLKIEFAVEHSDRKFPGRNFKIVHFVSLALSGKSALTKYYHALTGDQLTFAQMEEASKPTGEGLSFALDERKILGRKVKLVIEQANNKQGILMSKVTSILPELLQKSKIAKA